MKSSLLTVAFVLAGLGSAAQHELIKDHELGKAPVVPAEVKTMTEDIVILRRTVINDIQEEAGDMFEYSLTHYTIFLRDAGAIEKENKVYVSLNNAIDVVKVEARSIMPDGTVNVLEQADFKRATDDEERGSYLYFAFEGLVPGSIVDYYHVVKRSPNLRGDSETLQAGAPILRQDVHLLNPSRLVYKSKSYQGTPEALFDTSDATTQHMRWEMSNVPALEDEESANMGAAKMRICYKLDRIPDRNLKDFSGYVNATKLYHGIIYQEGAPKQKKDIAALVKKMEIPKGAEELTKVRMAEDYIKTHFQLLDQNVDELLLVESVLKNKACGTVGAMALMCAVLRELGVEHQIVVTSDRMRIPFDKDFESYLFLQDMALFLPSLGKYMDPTDAGLRLGYLDSGNMGNHGLFIKNFDVGGTITGVGTVKYIEPLPDNATVHDHIFDIRIGPDADACEMDFVNKLTGYYATLQCYYSLLDEEKRAELQHNLVEYLVENSEEQSLTAENGESKLFGVEPFIIKGKVKTRKFSASAGDKMLFKVGELIGPQVEMYSEKPRKLPVDDDYNRQFNRSITITLPAGWKVQNLADFAIDKHLDMDGKRQLAFECKATQEGNIVKIDIAEYYKQSRLPLDQYEGYRTVVNAAADFNKLALVLVKG